MIASYPSIYNIGHKAVKDLFNGPVLVEEKVDGSQISFQLGFDGVLRMRSKGAELQLEAPPEMFKRGVEYVKSIQHRLTPGLTYRGEYLSKPKHNVLCYDRVPPGHIIIYDIELGGQHFMDPEQKATEASRLGMETVPILYRGVVDSADKLRELLDTTSVLGGQKIEGVVVKPVNYDLYGTDKKVLLGKFVSESFKESHRKEWKGASSSQDIVTLLCAELTTPARWQKAIIHLKEKGLLEDSPRDIGILLKEIQDDVKSDSMDRIAEVLVSWAWPQIKRRVVAGFPEWYKERLLENQFTDESKEGA